MTPDTGSTLRSGVGVIACGVREQPRWFALAVLGATVASVALSSACTLATVGSSPTSANRSSASTATVTGSSRVIETPLEVWMRTDPGFRARFGATPHSGRLACAYAPIVPPEGPSVFARFQCLELIGSGPGAFVLTSSEDIVAMQVDMETGRVISWTVPDPGVAGDLDRVLPAAVAQMVRTTPPATGAAIARSLTDRCRAIAEALGSPS